MIDFLINLKSRNETLFYFGWFCFLFSLVFFILTKTSSTQVHQVNAWNKPLKFALSLGLYTWSMAWFCSYLPSFNLKWFNTTVVVLWSFEILYIAIQAARGQMSHYNLSGPVYSFLYALMAIAATTVTLYTAYIGLLFFKNDFPALPNHYLWSIRFGILIFVVFSFQGFLMGSRLNHSVGALNDNSNWFIIGWSKVVGDLRVAHFIGMHALQLIPLMSYYVLKNTKATIGFALLYLLLAAATLIQALQGRPLIKVSSNKVNTTTEH